MQTLCRKNFLSYFVWLLWGILLFILVRFCPQVFNSIILFGIFSFYILLLPGWLLVKIFKFTQPEFTSYWLIVLVFSFSFYFIGNFLAMLAHIDIGLLLKVYLGLLLVLWFIAFIKDGLHSADKIFNKNSLKELFNREALYLIPLVLVVVYIIWVVISRGADYNGDPYFHLAIVRKAVDGLSLSVRDLAFTKTYALNPAYIFPVWQIFLGLISKITSMDIVQAWSYMLLPLTIITVFTWYELSKVIFTKRAWAVIATIFFMIFVFYSGPGYLLSRLPVPDTLAQLIILPLGIAFVCRNLFKGKINWRDVGLIICLVILLILLHLPHYFYLLLFAVVLMIVVAIIKYKDIDYKAFLKINFKIILIILAPFIISAVFLECYLGVISSALGEFTKVTNSEIAYDSFKTFGLTYQYGYLLLPFVFLFIKNRRTLIIITLMLLVPLIYWTPLRDILTRYLSLIFTDRLLANTSLYFLVFTLPVGYLLYLLDKLFAKLTLRQKDYLEIIIFIILGILIIIGLNTEFLANFIYTIFYAKETNAFVGQYGFIFFLLSIILTLGLWYFMKYRQKKDIFQIASYQNTFLMTLLIAIIAFMALAPSIQNGRKYFTGWLTPFYRSINGGLPGDLDNDPEVINFIKTNLPSKSVILTDAETLKTFSVMLDQYMAYPLGSAWEVKLTSIYNPKTSVDLRNEYVTSPRYGINYVFIRDPQNQDVSYFESNQQLFKRIYNNKVQIYKVNK